MTKRGAANTASLFYFEKTGLLKYDNLKNSAYLNLISGEIFSRFCTPEAPDQSYSVPKRNRSIFNEINRILL